MVLRSDGTGVSYEKADPIFLKWKIGADDRLAITEHRHVRYADGKEEQIPVTFWYLERNGAGWKNSPGNCFIYK